MKEPRCAVGDPFLNPYGRCELVPGWSIVPDEGYPPRTAYACEEHLEAVLNIFRATRFQVDRM